MSKQAPEGYIEKDGYLVPVADAVLLESDLRLFGQSFMENIGCGYARRISPSQICIRTAKAAAETCDSSLMKKETP